MGEGEEGGREGRKGGRAEGRKEGSKEARKQGSKEARKQGSKEARKQGSKEARKQGSKEARKQGSKEGRKEGRKEEIKKERKTRKQQKEKFKEEVVPACFKAHASYRNPLCEQCVWQKGWGAAPPPPPPPNNPPLFLSCGSLLQSIRIFSKPLMRALCLQMGGGGLHKCCNFSCRVTFLSQFVSPASALLAASLRSLQ